jgi:hypothetical protein
VEVKTIYWTLYIIPAVSEMGSISISRYKGYEEVPILAPNIELSDNIRRQKQNKFPNIVVVMLQSRMMDKLFFLIVIPITYVFDLYVYCYCV